MRWAMSRTLASSPRPTLRTRCCSRSPKRARRRRPLEGSNQYIAVAANAAALRVRAIDFMTGLLFGVRPAAASAFHCVSLAVAERDDDPQAMLEPSLDSRGRTG